jgi:hypothetical protein
VVMDSIAVMRGFKNNPDCDRTVNDRGQKMHQGRVKA